MDGLRQIGAALALTSVFAVAATGCGGEKTDVSKGIDSYNERLTQQGIPAEIDCPDQVDGAAGTEFDCTLKANEGDKSAKIRMEIRKEEDDLIVIEKDQKAVERAIQTVVGQPGQQAQQGGQQPQQPQGGQQPQQPAPEQTQPAPEQTQPAP
jgi:Domain of unknown function (DUF4333)